MFSSSTTWHDKLCPLFISVLTYLHKDPVEVPEVLNKVNVLLVRRQVTSCFNPLYAQCKVLEQKYRTESINKFIAQRCSNYLDNQKGMINSILERKQRRIVLDRVLTKDDQNDKYTLITDPSAVATEVNHHFQHVAGGSPQVPVLSPRWSAWYFPITEIRPHWYQHIMTPPSLQEWSEVIRSLPNKKAPGPSGVSNEMLKQLGSSMHQALYQLIRLCFIHNDIPSAWRHATVYPIPKPIDWECNLNKTRPITLLETPRKAMVKILNNRLSQVMVKYNILHGSNHADLPGDFTLELLRIVNAILEDVRNNNKELWILFQDMSKAYDHVNLYMLNRTMIRLKFPSTCRQLILSLFTDRYNQVITADGLTDPYKVLVGID